MYSRTTFLKVSTKRKSKPFIKRDNYICDQDKTSNEDDERHTKLRKQEQREIRRCNGMKICQIHEIQGGLHVFTIMLKYI